MSAQGILSLYIRNKIFMGNNADILTEYLRVTALQKFNNYLSEIVKFIALHGLLLAFINNYE